jgi:hypothetical protein
MDASNDRAIEVVKEILEGTYVPQKGDGWLFETTRENALQTLLDDPDTASTLRELAKPAIVKEFGEDKYNLDDHEEVTYALTRLIRRTNMGME